jgi:hypothetical protein
MISSKLLWALGALALTHASAEEPIYPRGTVSADYNGGCKPVTVSVTVTQTPPASTITITNTVTPPAVTVTSTVTPAPVTVTTTTTKQGYGGGSTVTVISSVTTTVTGNCNNYGGHCTNT